MLPQLAALLLLPLAFSAPLNIRQTTSTCATGVHIIAARGSTEPQGEGPLQSLSNSIKSSIPGSTDTAVVYPAELFPYTSSEEDGVSNMQQLIQQYLTSCPKAKLVLTGYSQGAQIVADVLGGGTFTNSAPLAESYRSNILAAVLFGDPTHLKGQSYDAGSADGSGIFVRKAASLAQLNTYSAQLKSYCNDGDPICDRGLDLSKHTSEVQDYESQALAFVLSRPR